MNVIVEKIVLGQMSYLTIRALPSDNDCEALWVRIPKCHPIQ